MPRIQADNLDQHRLLMRTRLLDAFGRLLHERGYSHVTLASVAAAAGMARNTVYGYFQDKEALLMAFIDRSVEEFVQELRAAIEPLGDAPARLERCIRMQIDQFRQQPGAGSEAGMVDGAMLGTEGQAALMGHFRPLHELIEEIVADGVEEGSFRPVDPKRTATMIFSVLGAERVPVGMGTRDPETALDEVATFIINGLLARGPHR